VGPEESHSARNCALYISHILLRHACVCHMMHALPLIWSKNMAGGIAMLIKQFVERRVSERMDRAGPDYFEA